MFKLNGTHSMKFEFMTCFDEEEALELNEEMQEQVRILINVVYLSHFNVAVITGLLHYTTKPTNT